MPAAGPQDQGQARPPEMLLRRYRVMGPCGTGGFGTVLACWDTRLQRRVAIKRMPLAPSPMQPGAAGGQPIAAGASTMEEALAEARTSSMLTHPNIVTVHDFEVENGSAYLVMEYVDGLTLAQLLERVEGGTLTPDECAYLAKSVAGALAFAHEHGVLHLDIKPSNIMFDHDGAIKLCDFGMATLASATGYGGSRGGTVGYMPPEQIRGDYVDERSDVFSLAVVLWQALTGSDPFLAPTAEESLKKIEKGPRVRLSKIVPEAEGMAEEAIMGALDPAPSRRLSSVEEFASEVAFGLGDADEGRASIRGLLGQTEPVEADDEWDGERLSFAEKHPHVASMLPRLTSAVATCWAVARLAPTMPAIAQLPVSSDLIATIAFVAVPPWPPLGSLAVLVLFLWNLMSTAQSAGAIMLCGFSIAIAAAWWFVVGRRSHLSTAALLSPICLSAPSASAGIAGCDEPPLQAMATAAIAWVLGRFALAAAGQPLTAELAATSVAAALTSPASLISLAGCAASALACSLIARHGETTGWKMTAQIACAALLALTQSAARRVENGGIWQPPAWDTVGVAVVLCVLMCIGILMTSPSPARQEGDDIDEPA